MTSQYVCLKSAEQTDNLPFLILLVMNRNTTQFQQEIFPYVADLIPFLHIFYDTFYVATQVI